MKTMTSIQAENAIHRAIRHGATLQDLGGLSGLNRGLLDRVRLREVDDIPEDAADSIIEAAMIWAEFHPDGPSGIKVSDERRTALAEHISALFETGYDGPHLAHIVGVDAHLISDIRTGKAKRALRNSTAEALEALPADIRERVASPIGATRRLQALVRWGYPVEILADELVASEDEIENILAGEDNLDLDMLRSIPQVFNRLEQVAGPSDEARARGIEEGWPVPFQYDEYTIDRKRTSCNGARPANEEIEEVDPERQLETWQREINQLIDALAQA
ncbi:helix-turn-helix DNA binding protein [Gordonia phage Daredevil]|uniref:Antirepressor n=1 Tax=Gordonia phage Daredevil TaxID=2283286 RepID=A0A345MIT5_9CAUD|nr:helix-turn-helix DNA binding protein [Gordonia phage Daredevil]AXH70466.1 antirepressor [Gordonia phage Daredevil]